MNARNPKDAASRRAVTERLRGFFAALTTQLAAGTTEIWSRVERRLSEKAPDTEPGRIPHSSGLHGWMYEQPMQQQQSKAQPDDDK